MTERSFTAAEPLTDEQDTTMNIALFIVVPIFLVCYCGSCLAYIVYKIYRNCYRSHNKPHTVDLEGIQSPARPAVFPAYLHAPGQPLPPPVKPEGPSRYVKPPPSYEDQTDIGPQADHSDDVPISEILMKKMAQKSSTTAF